MPFKSAGNGQFSIRHRQFCNVYTKFELTDESDMVSGHLIGVETGRTAEVLSNFLKCLPPETAEKIEAIAMDMGPAYQKAVRDCLPNADIVFDGFHVMQNYSKAIGNQRRIEYRKANKAGKDLMKGCHYLLLKNADKLSESQTEKLSTLLTENANLNTLYLLKEQLQALWKAETVEDMQAGLEQWCLLAEETHMLYLKKFAKSLRKHRDGICNYAKHKLTSARIEAGNISRPLSKPFSSVQNYEFQRLG